MISAVDLFCGAGGLTTGLERAGVDVRVGVDVDPLCRYSIEQNTEAEFVERDARSLTSGQIRYWLRKADIRCIAGCAPCQPFSTYTQGTSDARDKRWGLLHIFRELAEDVRPELITMENVPNLYGKRVYQRFIAALRRKDYYVSENIVSCADYGVPQARKRLIVLASRLGPIELVHPTHPGSRAKTVRQAIGKLPRLRAGRASDKDPLHVAASLSEVNLERIRASRPGGSWREWPKRLVLPCHRRGFGPKYPSVYGRMAWDEPAPTMTTQCYNYGSGRFGHPQQHRAISLREAALLQSFPARYRFAPADAVELAPLGRLIGNAVPPRIGQIVGRSMDRHLEDFA